jgi:hypothetical protein
MSAAGRNEGHDRDRHVKSGDERRRILEAIDRACEKAATYSSFVVTPEYARFIEQVEAMPQNQSGSDKTGVELAWIREIEHYRQVWRDDRR